MRCTRPRASGRWCRWAYAIFADEELEVARADERVVQFTDYELAAAQFEGETWRTVCDRIVAALPRQVYVSFDIDG